MCKILELCILKFRVKLYTRKKRSICFWHATRRASDFVIYSSTCKKWCLHSMALREESANQLAGGNGGGDNTEILELQASPASVFVWFLGDNRGDARSKRCVWCMSRPHRLRGEGYGASGNSGRGELGVWFKGRGCVWSHWGEGCLWSQLSIELRSTLSSNPPTFQFTALKGRRISCLVSGSKAKINVDEQQSTQKCHFHQKTKTQSFRFLESTNQICSH